MSDLHTEGLQFLLEVAFSEEQSVPTNYYMALGSSGDPAEGEGLSDITELSGNGYAREVVVSNNTDMVTSAAGTGDYKVTTKTVTFTASGGAWSAANVVYLATTTDDAGKLIASATISPARTLQDQDTLDVSLVIQLNG